ncbi:MAG TPA: hypothetical protein VJN50_06415 [Actinomycetota bacterium]|nr:hypothetical protein [Actinomycetota bacterium]
MPDSFGKRQRREVKAKKAAAREERRVARNQRRQDRAAGILQEGAPVADLADESEDLGLDSRDDENEPNQNV